MSNSSYERVDARPTKRFFVEMLTRDLALEDAILDLLDNCVDGIQRSLEQRNTELDTDSQPYQGFWAKITISPEKFVIEDNCGGIPWSEHQRAFRMGRPAVSEQESALNASQFLSVGVYGIGMKRAIFKMGADANISTQNNASAYTIPISPDWMQDEDNWNLSAESQTSLFQEDGTKIVVQDLHQDIAERFREKDFIDTLLDKMQGYYAFILSKGFSVQVNGNEVHPDPILIRYSEQTTNQDTVRPYVFKGEVEDVEVFLIVGLREPIPDAEKTLAEQEVNRSSTAYAGWTVICNDRVVLYCNRDELTGWGTAGVPRYHNQFISISGVVEFRGDPSKLPTTTTKRGLNYSSSLYQQTLNRMREGLLIFIDFTNKWKSKEKEAREKVASVPAVSYSEAKEKAETTLKLTSVQRGISGSQYKPKLPLPPIQNPDVRISFQKDKEEVLELAEELLQDIDKLREREIPKQVGIKSFEFAFEQLVEKHKNSK
ncbi:MAG: ATP-binding protein [Bacteroidota bacterium]